MARRIPVSWGKWRLICMCGDVEVYHSERTGDWSVRQTSSAPADSIFVRRSVREALDTAREWEKSRLLFEEPDSDLTTYGRTEWELWR